jgi:hypothetical protein
MNTHGSFLFSVLVNIFVFVCVIRIYSLWGEFVVTILIRLMLYITYIASVSLSPPTPSSPHLKQLQEVS